MNTALNGNLNNLNKFWQALNAKEKDGVFTHLSWPNKQWNSDFSLPNSTLAATKSFSTIMDIDESDLHGLTIKNQLVPMALDLKSYERLKISTVRENARIVDLCADKNANNTGDYTSISAENWAMACGTAFGYIIDATVIQSLLTNPNASVLAYIIDGEIAGTAISYKTNNILGIHQLGTVPNYRKMGVAAALMDHLLNQASKTDDIYHVSLQASQAGLHLYEKMGFQALGKLTSLVIES
jgi:ribosomal protein S18 acetylase RimI-like enzyme